MKPDPTFKTPGERAALLLLGGLVEASVALVGEEETERLMFIAFKLPPKLPGETHAAWKIRTGIR